MILFDSFCDKNKSLVRVPNTVPNYLSVEDLDNVSFPKQFYYFSHHGYCVWLEKRYSEFLLKTRGFEFDGVCVSNFRNPHLTFVNRYNSFDLALSYFSICVLALVDKLRSNDLPKPINCVINLSDFQKRRRSKFVSKVFRLHQKLLPFKPRDLFGDYLDIF